MSIQKINSLSLFFPAYNEEKNIARLIENADSAAREVTDDYEIIIIDDGSHDDTASIVKNLLAGYPHLKLIKHSENLGYGAAVWTGFNTASKEWVFFSDADLQFDLSEISKLITFHHQYDVIIGYRQNRSERFARQLNAWGWKLLNRICFNLNESRDIDCAFKLIKSSAIKPLLPEIISRGAMISAEILIRLKKSKYPFHEVAVTHFPRTAGSPTGANLKVITRALRELITVWYTLHLRRPD